MLSLRVTSGRPAVCSSVRPQRPAAVPAPVYRSRTSIKRFSSDTGAENDDKLVNNKGEILQGRQEKKTSGDMVQEGNKPQSQPQSDVASPESGEKAFAGENKGPSEVAKAESHQQEDRAPLQD